MTFTRLAAGCLIFGIASFIANQTNAFPISDKDDLRVLAGQSMGQIKLGEGEEAVMAALGKADRGDASLGRLQLCWMVKPSAEGNRKAGLDVFFRRDDSGHHYVVTEIRASSPDFKTSEGVSPQSSLKTLRDHYPTLQRLEVRWADSSTVIYDSVNTGIAFEMDDEEKCSAIIVHKPGIAVVAMEPLR